MYCSQCGKKVSKNAKFCNHCGQKVDNNKMQEVAQQETSQVATNYTISAKNKKIGLFWLIGPIMGLILIIIAYAVLSFVGGSIDEGTIVIQIIKAILSILGIVLLVCFIVGIPLGIIYLNKKDLASDFNFNEQSGKGSASIVPDEVRRWNWGAFFLNWIWGIANNVYISLLCFVPYVGIIMPFILGAKGNEWAWRNKKWRNVEHFRNIQKKWTIWGLVIFVIHILLIFSLLSSLAIVALNSARARARDARRISDIKQIQTALELYYLDNNQYPISETYDIEGMCFCSDGFKSQCSGTTYMGIIPSSPEPEDGDCSFLDNFYYYERITPYDYKLQYCLGETVDDIHSGTNIATSMGLSSQFYNIDTKLSDDVDIGLDAGLSVKISVSKLRVRDLPSTKGKIIAMLSIGQIYPVIGEQNGWYEIKYRTKSDDIKIGWIMGRYTIDANKEIKVDNYESSQSQTPGVVEYEIIGEIVPEGSLVSSEGKVLTPKGEEVDNSAMPGSPDAPKQSRSLSDGEVPEKAIKLTVSASGFVPNEFDVKSGDVVTFSLTSADRTHVFKFDDASLQGVAIGVAGNETRAITFKAPAAGDYTFYCDVPGHRGRGETGVMHVK